MLDVIGDKYYLFQELKRKVINYHEKNGGDPGNKFILIFTCK